MEALVAQMLQLARMEEPSPGDVMPLDLGEAAQEVLHQMQPVAQEQGLELQADCAPGLMVRLSPERTQVLISNLLLNAIQHSRDGMAIVICVRRLRSEVSR